MDELFTFVKKKREAIRIQGKCMVNTPEFGPLWIEADLKQLHLK
jgi:hypothetical protein